MPQPLRVLLVSGPASGGIRRHLEGLLGGSPNLGVCLALAAPSDLSPLSDLSDTRYWTIDLGDRPRPIQDLAALLSLRRAVRDFRPDIIHAHGVKAALLALLLPLPGGVPVLVTLHNLWQGGKVTALLRRVLPRAKRLICVSEAVRDSFLSHGIAVSDAAIIPNGVTLPPETSREASPQVTVAYLGRLTREKGIDVLLEAWSWVDAAEAINRTDRLRLVIAGDGPLRSEVAQYLQQLGEDQPLGHVEDVGTVYSSADLVVIPSRSEGQSITALEAMSYGLPVIASDVGGLRLVVIHGATGLLVPAESPDALMEAILDLASDAERRARMGRAGRARVQERFSLERMLKRTREAYDTCAERA